MAKSADTSRQISSSNKPSSASRPQEKPTPPPQQTDVRRMKSFTQRLRKISMPSLTSAAQQSSPPVQEKPRPRVAYVPTHAASSFAKTTITPFSSTFIDERDEWAANAEASDADTAVDVDASVSVSVSVGSRAPCRSLQGSSVTSSNKHRRDQHQHQHQHRNHRQQQRQHDQDQEYPHRQRLAHHDDTRGAGGHHKKSRSTDSSGRNSSYSSASSTSRKQESSQATTTKTTTGDFAVFLAQAESKAAHERAFRNRMARRERLDAAVQGIATTPCCGAPVPASGAQMAQIPCSLVGTKRDSAYYSVGSNARSHTSSSVSGGHQHQHHQQKQQQQQQQQQQQHLSLYHQQQLAHKTSKTLSRRISEYFKPSVEGSVAVA